MSNDATRSKLAVVLNVEVVGYERLVKDDSAATERAVTKWQAVMKERVGARGGHLIDMALDESNATFPNAIDALRVALGIQGDIKDYNAALPVHRRVRLRMGVDLGEVDVTPEGAISGEPVAIAARVGSLLPDEGICVSAAVVEHARTGLYLTYDALADVEVEGVTQPVSVYRILSGVMRPPTQPARRRKSGLALAAAAVVLVVAGGTWYWIEATKPAPTPKIVAIEPAPQEQYADALAMPSGPSIAVLPFVNHSGDPEQDYFAKGLSLDIASRLTRYPELTVIASTSVARLKGAGVDHATVGRELGVRFLVEGGVRKSGSRVRVTATLLDTTTGETIWGETYERELTPSNVFEVQDDITESTVGVIADVHGMIRRVQLEALANRSIESLEAFECVLRANAYYYELNAEEHLLVRGCLERAIEEEPDYVEAWAILAGVYVDEHSLGFNPQRGSLRRAIETAREAVRLDPSSHYGHYILAHANFILRELGAFQESARRALELNSNNTDVLALLGLEIAYAGDWENGVALVEKARKLNPFHPDWFHFPIVLDHFRKGADEAALKALMEIDMPDFFWTQIALAQIHGQLGNLDEARAAAAKLEELYPGFSLDAARSEYAVWNMSEDIVERAVEGLRKAGVPEGTWN
jgi:TolB-like protein/class 3 adenylate cyclase